MGKGFRFRWKGLTEATEGLRSFEKVIKEEIATTTEQDILPKVFQRSQELVPVQTGELKASGRIEGNKIIYDAPHAAEVHEDVAAFHDNGQAKYVESSFEELKPDIDKAMSDAAERAWKRIVKK